MSDETSGQRFGTRVIHGGQRPDPLTGAVMPPIYATSTYVQSSPGRAQGLRILAHPQPDARCAAGGAGRTSRAGRAGFAFASGMAATATAAGTAGRRLAHHRHERSVRRQLPAAGERAQALRRARASPSWTSRDAAALETAIRPDTRLLWVETPTNPLLKLVDLSAVAKLARSRGILCVCDNTFATPYLQRPLEHGFDVVMHSTTKYLNGHSDAIGGAAIVRADKDARRAPRLSAERAGRRARARSTPSSRCAASRPWRCAWSGTAPTRSPIAQFLEEHPAVERVIYPGLASHPQHALARRQMASGYGGIVTAVLRGGLDAARRMLERCQLFSLAESLGGVESLIEHPAIMTHASLPPLDARRARHQRRADPPLGRRRGHRRPAGGTEGSPRLSIRVPHA